MKAPEQVKLTQAEGEALIRRIQASDLAEEDRRVLERLIHTNFRKIHFIFRLSR